MKDLYGIPQDVIDKFRSLGAIKLSRTFYDGGMYGDLFYFWSLDPLKELGYYSLPTKNYQVISRKWGEVSLSLQKFEDIRMKSNSNCDCGSNSFCSEDQTVEKLPP